MRKEEKKFKMAQRTGNTYNFKVVLLGEGSVVKFTTINE